MSSNITRVTKRILDLMFYVGLVIELVIPVIFHFIGRFITVFRIYYIPQCIIYMLSGVMVLMIVHELREMFKTVLQEDPFVDCNSNSLKRMSICSFIISILSIIRFPLSPTPATVVIIIVFLTAGLFSMVLCQVFEVAIQYKKENDLTI